MDPGTLVSPCDNCAWPCTPTTAQRQSPQRRPPRSTADLQRNPLHTQPAQRKSLCRTLPSSPGIRTMVSGHHTIHSDLHLGTKLEFSRLVLLLHVPARGSMVL